MKIKQCLLMAMALFITGCSHLDDEQRGIKRQGINEMADSTLHQLMAQDEKLNKSFEESLAYLVVNMKVTKVPVVGVGSGEGVLFVKAEKEPVFYRVQRWDLGAGWGARSYKVLVLLYSQDVIDKVKHDHWAFDIGGEASVGTAAMEGASSGIIPEYSVHILSDGGVSASITARAIRMSKSDLNMSQDTY
ncbi:lipid-binding SYLF domain-containing protein [Aeromonas sanarellii]|uniref:hypothetical protein n=1 Tax=Aeromonas sanarellii TaxID=633415 RepID=UPI003988AB96